MSRKRRNTSSAEPDSPPSKRRLSEQHYNLDNDEDISSDEHEQPQIDATFGQVGAFPGLVNNPRDALFYGPAQDGIDYLRMVRSEATTIPSLLTAIVNEPQAVAEDNNENGHDHDGFFDEDEAYIAGPYYEQQPELSINKAQQCYYELMITKFYALRTELRRPPPLQKIQALSASVPISFPSSSKPARHTWEAHILQNFPHPVQIASMDDDSVLVLLSFMTKRMRRMMQSPDLDGVQRIGAWLWAVLAKCADRGELTSEGIAELRSCAKAANLTWQWLQGRLGSALSDARTDTIDFEMDEDSDSSVDDVSNGGTEEAKQRKEEMDEVEHAHHDLSKPVTRSAFTPVEHHYIILDMIITVVGEVYGQRDLLELRRPWK